MKFWDSSAVVPMLVAEPTTDTILDVVQNDPEMLVWWATEVECASALARLERDEALTTEANVVALARLSDLKQSGAARRRGMSRL